MCFILSSSCMSAEADLDSQTINVRLPGKPSDSFKMVPANMELRYVSSRNGQISFQGQLIKTNDLMTKIIIEFFGEASSR